MWVVTAALLVTTIAAEYIEDCPVDSSGKKFECTLCGTATQSVTSAAPRGGSIRICAELGLDLNGNTLTIKQGQKLYGPGLITGDVVINAKDTSVLDGVHITGRLTISNGDCTNTIVRDATIDGGLVVAPSGKGAVNIDNSVFKNIVRAKHTSASDEPVAVAIAHASGSITVECSTNTAVLVQPAAHATFAPSYVNCLRVIDLGILFNVFGEDLERVIFDDVLPPESLFLKTYITLAAAVTVGAFLLRA